MYNRELFGLAWLGSIIHWLEELTAMLAGPILTAGLGIALIDMLTGGKLLADSPALLFAWAVSQALGLDAQLVGAAAKLGAAIRRRAGWAIVGYALLVAPLGYVAFQASSVFSTQQAEAITTAQALARLGMNSSSWIVERSALAVLLVILSGMLRYAAPAKVAASLADEQAKLERELTLEPLRQRLRAQQVGGLRALAETALRGAGEPAASELSAARSHTREPIAATAPALPPIRARNVSQDAAAPQGSRYDIAPFEASERLPTASQNGQEAAMLARPDGSYLSDATDNATDDDPPPSGGLSSPTGASKRTGKVTPITRCGPGRAPRRDRRTSARANARSGYRGNAEARIRAALASRPSMSDAQLMRAADVSSSTVSKWRRVIEAEERAVQQAAQ